MHKILKSKGSNPKVYITENDFSSDLKEAMEKYTIDFQISPLHMKRQNAEEQKIRTSNNNFISVLSTTDPYFTISERDRIISKWLITLNILQNSTVNPALSEYAYIYGPYKFNKYPMAMPGTCVIVHDKPVNCMPWVHHGTQGWYIGT